MKDFSPAMMSMDVDLPVFRKANVDLAAMLTKRLETL